MMRRGVAAVLAAAVVLVAGCDAIAGVLQGPPLGPRACGELYNAVRCQTMTAECGFRPRKLCRICGTGQIFQM